MDGGLLMKLSAALTPFVQAIADGERTPPRLKIETISDPDADSVSPKRISELLEEDNQLDVPAE